MNREEFEKELAKIYSNKISHYKGYLNKQKALSKDIINLIESVDPTFFKFDLFANHREDIHQGGSVLFKEDIFDVWDYHINKFINGVAINDSFTNNQGIEEVGVRFDNNNEHYAIFDSINNRWTIGEGSEEYAPGTVLVIQNGEGEIDGIEDGEYTVVKLITPIEGEDNEYDEPMYVLKDTTGELHDITYDYIHCKGYWLSVPQGFKLKNK